MKKGLHLSRYFVLDIIKIGMKFSSQVIGRRNAVLRKSASEKFMKKEKKEKRNTGQKLRDRSFRASGKIIQ
jgi:hypothetical protein